MYLCSGYFDSSTPLFWFMTSFINNVDHWSDVLGNKRSCYVYLVLTKHWVNGCHFTSDFQPLSVPLFNSSILGNITEFHVGMETVVMETITLPEGCFPEVSFVAGFPRVEHVDIRRKECVFGRNVKKEHFCISHLHAFKSVNMIF